MKIYLLLAALFIIPYTGYTQKIKSGKVYKVWVYTMDDVRVKGYLSHADSTGIVISGAANSVTADARRIAFNNIKSVNYRRKGAGGRGAGIGFTTGAALGFLGGIAGGDRKVSCSFFGGPKNCVNPAEEYGAAYAIVGAVIGTPLGAIVGGAKGKITIEGKFENYSKQLGKLKALQIPDEQIKIQ